MLVMVVFFIAFRWIHLSTRLIRLLLLVLILLLMPTLNFLPVWFALSLLRFRLPSRLPMMFILWMVAMMVVIFFFQAEDGIRDLIVTGVQTCALPIFRYVTPWKFDNHNSTVVVIELPGGDISKAKIYKGPQIFGPGSDLYPVTLSFPDPNEIGRASCRERV